MKNIDKNIKKAISLHQNHQLFEAEKLYKKIISLDPDNFNANHLLGALFVQTKNYTEGMSYIKKSISINPKNAWPYNNLANAQIQLKDYKEALKNCNHAIFLDLNFLDAYNNRGNIFFELKEFKKAVDDFHFILSIDENYVDSYFNLAQAYIELKDYTSAILNLEKAYKINPNFDKILSDLLHSKMIICDWSNIDELLLKLRNNITNSKTIHRPFPILNLFDDSFVQKKVAEKYTNNFYSNHVNNINFDFNYKNKKIRIGYFSSDFLEHPVGILIDEIFKNHDRNKFEIFGFYIGDLQSSKNFKEKFDAFYEIKSLSEIEVSKLSRKIKIDIAINLNGYTKNNIMNSFSFRMAPIQVNFLGYPGTLSAKYMDYIIADKIVIPENDKINFFEKVVYLPHCYMPNPSQRIISENYVDEIKYLKSKNKFVFCSFCNSYKINPKIFNSWIEILKKIKNGILWLQSNYNNEMKINLIRQVRLNNIDSNRIIFAKRLDSIEDHLSRYKYADLFLDTFPFNGHTTVSDSLFVGLPVLTIKGNSFTSRVASSLLYEVDLEELITNNFKDYIEKAIEIASNPVKHNELKIKLEKNKKNSNLFNNKLYTKNIEKAYIKMYEIFLNNEKPSSFKII